MTAVVAKRRKDSGKLVRTRSLCSCLSCVINQNCILIGHGLSQQLLGDLKAEAAAPCLVQLLGYNYPPIGSPVSKTDETLRDVDPAFAALVQIGAPAVPAIGSHLPLLHPENSLMAIQILRMINTPAAKEAADAYIKLLEDQIRLTKQVVAEFGKDRDSYLK